ncbi:MAG: hypothetical protein M0Z95_18505, partial [Actinomycetota bacterium]|nr:hypothetical protein [Actinomycetota bacterium]
MTTIDRQTYFMVERAFSGSPPKVSEVHGDEQWAENTSKARPASVIENPIADPLALIELDEVRSEKFIRRSELASRRPTS